jgi:hypothetical protein
MNKLLIVALLSGCSLLLARTSPLSPSQPAVEPSPQRGLKITQGFHNNPAESAGHTMDVITKYGDLSANVQSDSIALPNVPSNMTKATDRWHVYTAPDKSFSVEVPCNLIDQYHNDMYSCDVEDNSSLNFFLIEVLNMSDAARAKMKDELEFERNIKRELTPNRHVIKMVPIKVDGGIGREILVTDTSDPDDNSRARIIIVGRRYYVVAFNSNDPKALQTPMAERFLSTFKVFSG